MSRMHQIAKPILLPALVLAVVPATAKAEDACSIGDVHGYTDTPLVSGTNWHVHDPNRPQPPAVAVSGPVATPPPEDAVVLYDGSTIGLRATKEDTALDWIVEGDVLTINTNPDQPNGGGARSIERFGDIQLHVEWRAPVDHDPFPQRAGNSGIFFMGRYELQVQHSYCNATYPDGQAAAIYGQTPPLVNASLPAGEWQSFDVVFKAPRFAEDGALKSPAHMTVFHNGVLVQDHTRILGPTAHRRTEPYMAHAAELPIVFQDHGEAVSFRNIWARRIRN